MRLRALGRLFPAVAAAFFAGLSGCSSGTEGKTPASEAFRCDSMGARGSSSASDIVSCVGCSASDEALAVDSDLDSFAELTLSGLTPGQTASLRATSGSGESPASGGNAGAIVGLPSGPMVNYSATVSTFLAGVQQQTGTAETTVSGNVDADDGTFDVYYGISTVLAYDAVEISISNSQQDGALTYRIYEICTDGAEL